MDFYPAQRLPLQAHLAELRRRCATVGRFQGGRAGYWGELRLFEEYAREQAFLLEDLPSALRRRAPDDEGNEHQVWFDATPGRFTKLTWPGFFGLKVVYRPDEEARCSPIDYLERWHWHNVCFGDQVEFLGACRSCDGFRLLIQQPAIAGHPVTEKQIEQFFVTDGWLPFAVQGQKAFYDPERRLAVSDTHPGNLIGMEDGLLAPIDLRVQVLDDVLASIVESWVRG